MNEVQDESQTKFQLGNYRVGKTVGQGTFNKVKSAQHVITHEKVAVKIIPKDKIISEGDHRRLNKELKILRKIRHPNIIQLYEILEDQHHYYLITEYASRGQLFEHIVKNQKLTEFEASKIIQQILNAIQYMHQIGVIHRDLKPQNVLLDYKYNVKIVDFGLSNIYSKGQMLKTACGSPCYAPPEMIAGRPYDPLKVDIWSLGIILYAMCVGYLPFDDPDSAELFRIIKEAKYQLPEHASDELRSLLKLILDVNPLTRGTIYQIRNHKFCVYNRVPVIGGIIQGLSTIPYEPKIQRQMHQLVIETSELQKDITNNKHNKNTATYYLLLQKELRHRNQTILNYYISKDYMINRYKLIEKVKMTYDRKLQQRIDELEQSRKIRTKSTKKKRSKTTDKKYHTGVESNSKSISKNLFNTPTRHRHQSKEINSIKKSKSKTKRKLKRTK